MIGLLRRIFKKEPPATDDLALGNQEMVDFMVAECFRTGKIVIGNVNEKGNLELSYQAEEHHVDLFVPEVPQASDSAIRANEVKDHRSYIVESAKRRVR